MRPRYTTRSNWAFGVRPKYSRQTIRREAQCCQSLLSVVGLQIQTLDQGGGTKTKTTRSPDRNGGVVEIFTGFGHDSDFCLSARFGALQSPFSGGNGHEIGMRTT